MQQVNAVKHGFSVSFAAAAAGFVVRVGQMFSRWHERRNSVRHLESLSDYHLKDLGIDRSDVRSVVYGRTTGRIHV